MPTPTPGLFPQILLHSKQSNNGNCKVVLYTRINDAKRFIATFTFDKNLFELKGKFGVRTSQCINFLTPRLNFLTKSVHQKCVYNMLRQV